MLRLIRNNDPYTVIMLFIFALLVKMTALMHPQMPNLPEGHILYVLIVRLFNYVLNGSAFGFTMLTVIMLFFQALYLNRMAFKYKLFAKQTHIIAFIYIVLSSLSREFNYFSAVLMLNWCLLGAFDILLGLHQTSQPRKHIFNAGFVLSVAAIIHFPAVIYILLLFISLLLLRSFNPGEWVVGILGFLTGIYFYAAILFLADRLPEFFKWIRIGFSPENIGKPLYMTGTITGVIVLLVCGLAVLQQQLGRIGIFVRRNWVILIMCVALSSCVALFTPVIMRNEWLAIIPSLALIIAHPFYLEKNKAFSNFVFYFSLALVVFCQFTY